MEPNKIRSAVRVAQKWNFTHPTFFTVGDRKVLNICRMVTLIDYHWNGTNLRIATFSMLSVCVFIFFHREGFFRLQNVQDILEGTDQRSCVVNISWLRYAKFHHRRIWKCHISSPKTKTPAVFLLERKRYDIMRSAKRRYILI